MSVHSRFDKPVPVNRLETAPIVLRFESMFPRDLKRRDMHDKRTGGDLTHIRIDLSNLNTQPVGGPDWIERLHAEIEAAMEHNFEEEIAARERKGRFLEAERLRERGPADPWKFTQDGPLREGVLTVNKRWLGGAGHENWDPERVEAFKQRGLAFLQEHFPGTQLSEVDIDEDEEALHFHFLIVVWVEKVSQNRGCQWLIQPSANPLLANYEHAQDLAGAAFLDLGIHRGERRAAAAREAQAAGLEMPEPPRHVPPSQWRREQRRLALEDRDRIRDATRAEAATTVADGVALAKSVVKKSRKRAIAEAKARKTEADRHVAAAERDQARAEEAARAAQMAADAARIETQRLVDEAKMRAAQIIEGAEEQAASIVAEATVLATGAVRKSRKRAVAEARAKTAEADRAAAAAERARVQEEARAERARQARNLADVEREVAEGAALAARTEAARVRQAAEEEADQIRNEAAAHAKAEQACADAARLARDEAETAQKAADLAAAEATRLALAQQAEANEAVARVNAVTIGLAALSDDIIAGTLRCSVDGEIIAGSSHLLRTAYPEIRPAVEAAVSVVESARAIRRDAAGLARATSAECKEALAAITRDREAAAAEIAHEREATRVALENQRAEVDAELATQRQDLEQKITLVQSLLDRIQPLLTRVIRWLSRPELPASMKEEGLDIAGEAIAVLGALRHDDPGT